MGTGNINVRKPPPTRKSGQPPVEHLFGNNGLPGLRLGIQSPAPSPLQADRPGICGAMAQQRGDYGHGNQSAQQKLVHLVGCREPRDSEAKSPSKPAPSSRPAKR